MLRLLGRFGRSRDLRLLDQQLQMAAVYPAMVPDAVKLAIIRLLKATHGTAAPHFPEAATLVAYCVLGSDAFDDANGSSEKETVDRRLEAAIAAGQGLDAQLILLTMHARLIQPDVVERYGLKIEV